MQRVLQGDEENQSPAHSSTSHTSTPSPLIHDNTLIEQKSTQQALNNIYIIDNEINITNTELGKDLDMLQEPYRTALFLHYIEKQSYPEMATQLNLPVGTVKSHVNRGNKLLQSLVSQKGEIGQSQNARGQEQGIVETQDIKGRLHLIPEPYRTALFLHYIEKRSYPEMATQLDIPVGTVKSHVSRGRKMLSTNAEYRLVEHGSNELNSSPDETS